ncbi:efflux RND transporter periplasmic adaptor subunit [Halomonas sp. E14]|uniref:efflux RND transporter periplasmic adaptor subunit n=1 Tax=Halomonas sp. E14 TaxID=3397245 RepID=UPI00403E7F3A
MKRGIAWLLLIALGLSGCNDTEEPTEPPTRVVKLYQAGQQEVAPSRRFVGRVAALQSVDLSFRVSGRLQEFPAVQGTVIPRGELIARLDPTDYELAVRRAEAEQELARRQLARQRSLLEQNAIAQADVDAVRTEYELADVQLDSARRDLEHTTLEAPFDALVTRRLVENHSNVPANAEVVRVQDVSELRIRINVPESLVRHLDDPSRFRVQAELVSMPGQRLPLTFRERVTEPDPVAQTYEVEFALDDDVPLVALPGMTASVYVELREAVVPPIVMVPVSALAKDEAGRFHVWRYDADSETVAAQRVTVGEISGDYVPVIAGLRHGETIVAAGVHLLREGMTVAPLRDSL